MIEDCQVRPDIMYVVNFMIFNNAFHKYLEPGWNTYYSSNVPIMRLTGNHIQFVLPFSGFGYFPAGLVKGLKPERQSAGSNSTQIAGIVNTIEFKACTTSKHKNTFF